MNGLDTRELQRQLGATHENTSLEERGILRLSQEEVTKTVTQKRSAFHPKRNFTINWEVDLTGFVDDYYYAANLSTPLWIVNSASIAPTTLFFCPHCEPFPNSLSTSVASVLHASLFENVLRDTDSPALALQAYFTSLLRLVYHTWVPSFDLKQNVTTISYVDRLAPVSVRGFWIVMAIIFLHVLVCIITTVAFFTQTHFSMLGNVWAALAQVVHSKLVQEVLQQDGTMKTDKDIKRILKEKGYMERRYRASALKEDGRVAILSEEKDEPEYFRSRHATSVSSSLSA